MRKPKTERNGPDRLNAVSGNDSYRRIISTTALWIFSNLRRLWNSASRSLYLTTSAYDWLGIGTRRPVRQSTNRTTFGSRHSVLLATCTALFVINDFISKPQVKILIDPGLEISLITNKLVTQHRLQKTCSTLTITGVGGLSTGPLLYRVALTLQSRVLDYSLVFRRLQ